MDIGDVNKAFAEVVSSFDAQITDKSGKLSGHKYIRISGDEVTTLDRGVKAYFFASNFEDITKFVNEKLNSLALTSDEKDTLLDNYTKILENFKSKTVKTGNKKNKLKVIYVANSVITQYKTTIEEESRGALEHRQNVENQKRFAIEAEQEKSRIRSELLTGTKPKAQPPKQAMPSSILPLILKNEKSQEDSRITEQVFSAPKEIVQPKTQISKVLDFNGLKDTWDQNDKWSDKNYLLLKIMITIGTFTELNDFFIQHDIYPLDTLQKDSSQKRLGWFDSNDLGNIINNKKESMLGAMRSTWKYLSNDKIEVENRETKKIDLLE
ncbi:MAG: hypothetical protein H0W88_03845 [Parachlamydiaceae bacterium]|nr:hypothetical protein [Parachlamydiaceae bacterium]